MTGYGTNEGDGRSFTSAASNGKLYYNVANYGGTACAPQTQSSFTTDATWVRATNGPSSATGETNGAWDFYIPFRVDENTTRSIREARIGLLGSTQRTTFGQAAARRPPSTTCPTTGITYSRTSWVVGDRYYGSGFTQPWAKMSYGSAGGCRANGLLLSEPGRVRICGYGVDDLNATSACNAAPAPTRATHTNDPSAGAVINVTSSGTYTAMAGTPAAQWVEFLVQESTTSGTLSLKAGTSPTGETVYLHFGYDHASDLSYGDADYGRWGVGTPTWTFSPAESASVDHPTLEESTNYPGMFRVSCASTNGRPTGGFTVSVSATRRGTTYMTSVVHTAYSKICKP